MNNATKTHIFLSGSLVTISVLALSFQWNWLISGAAVLLVNIYLIAMLYEAVHRSGAERKVKEGVLLAKPHCFFAFPDKAWTGLLVLFIVSTSISGFANMYLDSEEVVYLGPVIESSVSNNESNNESIITVPAPSIMKDKIDALYFSLVTMITLGYGDYIPVSTFARLLVIWQLATGGLLVIGVFPLIISRVADF